MRTPVLAVVLLALSTASSVFADVKEPVIKANDRVKKAKAASDALLNLTFYKDGRGMILPAAFFNQEKGLVFKASEPLGELAGFNFDKDHFVGVFNRQYKSTRVFALGCVACHSGKAAGQIIPGIGNKNIDVYQAGQLALKAASVLRAYDSIVKTDGMKDLLDGMDHFYKRTIQEDIANLTQGLVSTTIIRTWFYDSQKIPMPKVVTRGQVKVPHLFGYAQKREVGLFADGKGNGHPAGWGLAVELAAGQKPEVIRELMHQMEGAESILGDLLPPAYPFAINVEQANRGEVIFESNCARCHGSHERDAAGLPVYVQPELIDWEYVKTDFERLKEIDGFYDVVESSELGDLMRFTRLDPGYIAPRLHGIWARFPYLHNASVPSIRDLLTVDKDRPMAFSLKDSGEKYRFDQRTLGLTMPARISNDYKKLVADGKNGKRNIYDVSRNGQGNQGHNFGTKLSEEDKTHLIEYLKTL